MSKPVIALFDIVKKSPVAIFCAAMPIDGIAKKALVKATDFVEVPLATSSPVSYLFCIFTSIEIPDTNALVLKFLLANRNLNLKYLPLKVVDVFIG